MTDPDTLEQPIYYGRPVMKPTARTWIKHILLLGVTICTTTIAGTLFPFGHYDTMPDADPQTAAEFWRLIVALPLNYGLLVIDAIRNLFATPENLTYGLSFSLSLLFILICHEMGHYIACRLYRVDATLPFFLPTPPMIGPAGTFGAFIKILSPMPSRKAVFDIGVAGPIAGFLALIPIAIVGVLTMEPAAASQLANPVGISFADPLFM